VTRALAAALIALALATTPAAADADVAAGDPPAAAATCDPARAARLARVLHAEARAAARWRWSWAAVFGAAAVGQLAVAAADLVPDDDRHHARLTSLYLGAGKATIGLGARLIIPPRVARPRPTGDACADDRAARAAIAWTAVRERRSMALNVFGGLSLNVGTSLYLGLHEDSWTDAGISFAMGTVVSVISALTQPRRVWRRGGVDGDGPLVVGWQVTPWLDGRRSGLAVVGAF